MRVTVYAEGAGEVPTTLFPAGRALAEDDLGPAHLLVRRCLVQEARIPEASICFVAPRRMTTGRHLKGSDLLVPSVLDKLFVPVPGLPDEDLVVLLVDQDGDRHRERMLRTLRERHARKIAIGVAVPEFESWLLADLAAARQVLGREIEEPPAIETLPPGEVKAMLRAMCDASGQRTMRNELAARCALDRVKNLRSFEAFCKDIKHVLGRD